MYMYSANILSIFRHDKFLFRHRTSFKLEMILNNILVTYTFEPNVTFWIIGSFYAKSKMKHFKENKIKMNIFHCRELLTIKL